MLKRVASFTKYHLVAVVLLGLMLPVLTTGRGVAYLPVALVLLFLGSFMLARLPKLKSIDRGLLFWGYLGLFAWSSLSLFWSVNRYLSAVFVLKLAIAGGAFVLAYQVKEEKSAVNLLVRGYLVVAALFSLHGLWVYLIDNYNRVTSTFYMANPMAIFLLPAVVLAMWYWGNSGKKFYLVTAVITASAFYLTLSRTSFLLLVLLALAAGSVVRRKAGFWLRLLVVIVAVAVCVVGVNYSRSTAGTSNLSAKNRLAKLNEDASTQTSASDRIYYLKSALAIWQDNPVAGTGAGTFSAMHPKYQLRPISASAHAHNFYAQVTSELGLVGAALVVVILAGLAQGCARMWQKDRSLAPAVVVVILLVVHFGLDVDSGFTALLALLGAFAGLVYAPDKNLHLPKPMFWVLAILTLLIPALSIFSSNIHKGRAVFLQSLGEYAEAASEFGKASSGIVYDPANLTGEGINYFVLAPTKKDSGIYYDLAEDRAGKAIAQTPKDAQHYLLLGRIKRRTGKLEEARANFAKAVELDPYNEPNYYIDYANTYLESDPAKVVEITSKALDQYTDAVLENRHIVAGYAQSVARIYQVKALALRKLSNPTEAEVLEKKAAEILQKFSAPVTL